MAELLQAHRSYYLKQKNICILGMMRIQTEVENKFREGNPESQRGGGGNEDGASYWQK